MATPENLDPFDPERLRVSQDFADSLGVEDVLTTLPVRRPDRQWFVRVHPTLRIDMAVLELKDDNETYMVDPEIQPHLADDLVFKTLLLSVNRSGPVFKPFWWAIRLPSADGKLDQWNRSARAAAQLAEKYWVRVKANRIMGAYDVQKATGDLPEPVWPDLPLRDLLQISFQTNRISSLDHPVVQQLRGRT